MTGAAMGDTEPDEWLGDFTALALTDGFIELPPGQRASLRLRHAPVSLVVWKLMTLNPQPLLPRRRWTARPSRSAVADLRISVTDRCNFRCPIACPRTLP